MKGTGTIPENIELIASELEANGNSPILKTIFDGFPDGILVVDRFFKAVIANKAFEKLVNKTPAEIEDKSCYYICHDSNTVCGDCQADNVFMNMHPPSRIRKCQMTGSDKQFEIFNFPIKNSDGEIHYMIEYIKDITDKQNLEKELMERRRLAIIGEMAAKTSHEIRNPLNAMEGAAHYLLEEFSDEPKIQKYLGLIKEQISRLNDVTSDLLKVAKPRKNIGEKDYINSTLIKSLEIVEYMIGDKDIEIELFLDETLPKIKFDQSAMQEVFVNILKNASDAVTEKGRIEVVGQLRQRKGEDFVEVSIIDNGIGIEPADTEKVFETFYTTKDHGTGLGLPIVNDLMKTHGGYIFMEGEPGGGTCVVLGLPVE